MKKLFWTNRQVDRYVRNALKGEQYYSRKIEGARNRAVDFACGLEDACAELRAENERLLTENQQLKDMIESLRWRTFTLLRSSDQKAGIFGLPKYTLDGLDAVKDVEPDEEEQDPTGGDECEDVITRSTRMIRDLREKYCVPEEG